MGSSQITDKQAQVLLDFLINEYKDQLPSPIHEPVQFEYKLKLFKYFSKDVFEALMSVK